MGNSSDYKTGINPVRRFFLRQAPEHDTVEFRRGRILFALAVLFLLFLSWLFRPGDPLPVITLPVELPEISFTVEQAEDAVRRAEREAGPLKPDNHARIIWNPEYRDRKAPCSIVYIHGFSASYGEGAPVHARLARDLGCHLYVSRLHGHGLRTDEPLVNFQPDSLLASAGRALAIGNVLGDKVILIGNSMGGTISLHLTAMHPEWVDALVLFAPVIEFATPASHFFGYRWAQRIMRLVLGEPYLRFDPQNDDHARYWYNYYRMEALAVLQMMKQDLLHDELYARIRQPVFAGYFYKDDDEQDAVVSVQAIKEMERKLGTLPERRDFRAFPDAGAHVISSAYRSDEHAQVREAVTQFLRYQLFL